MEITTNHAKSLKLILIMILIASKINDFSSLRMINICWKNRDDVQICSCYQENFSLLSFLYLALLQIAVSEVIRVATVLKLFAPFRMPMTTFPDLSICCRRKTFQILVGFSLLLSLRKWQNL